MLRLKTLRNASFCLRRYSSKAYPGHTIVKMPALSPTMTQGNLGEWKKSVGDEVTPGDILVEIETDKAQMEFECQDEGFLAKIFINGGSSDVLVNTPICVLAENKSDIGAFADFAPPTAGAEPVKAASTPETPSKSPEKAKVEAAAPATVKPTETVPATQSKKIIASPLAKSLAIDGGIDLRKVKGTGPGGRIVKSDVLNYRPSAAPNGNSTPTLQYADKPLSSMRKIIADRMVASKTQVPHYYETIELDMTRVLKLREALNKEANGNYKLSVNDFVVKASSLALVEVPTVNSSWHDSFVRQYSNADIAVAVATKNGLITPIVHSADLKGLATISNGLKNLAEKARAGKLQPEEYQGGSFTISNLGMYGIQHFTAIVNQPHAAILAVGSVEDKLVLDNSSEKGFKAIKVMKTTLSSDHRIVDGAVAAEWLQAFKRYIENPLSMML